MTDQMEPAAPETSWRSWCTKERCEEVVAMQQPTLQSDGFSATIAPATNVYGLADAPEWAHVIVYRKLY